MYLAAIHISGLRWKICPYMMFEKNDEREKQRKTNKMHMPKKSHARTNVPNVWPTHVKNKSHLFRSFVFLSNFEWLAKVEDKHLSCIFSMF